MLNDRLTQFVSIDLQDVKVWLMFVKGPFICCFWHNCSGYLLTLIVFTRVWQINLFLKIPRKTFASELIGQETKYYDTWDLHVHAMGAGSKETIWQSQLSLWPGMGHVSSLVHWTKPLGLLFPRPWVEWSITLTCCYKYRLQVFGTNLQSLFCHEIS